MSRAKKFLIFVHFLVLHCPRCGSVSFALVVQLGVSVAKSAVLWHSVWLSYSSFNLRYMHIYMYYMCMYSLWMPNGIWIVLGMAPNERLSAQQKRNMPKVYTMNCMQVCSLQITLYSHAATFHLNTCTFFGTYESYGVMVISDPIKPPTAIMKWKKCAYSLTA